MNLFLFKCPLKSSYNLEKYPSKTSETLQQNKSPSEKDHNYSTPAGDIGDIGAPFIFTGSLAR